MPQNKLHFPAVPAGRDSAMNCGIVAATRNRAVDAILLKEAVRRGSDVTATIRPLCQFNLDAYHDQMDRRWGRTRGLRGAFGGVDATDHWVQADPP